jgi:hypothetical protein
LWYNKKIMPPIRIDFDLPAAHFVKIDEVEPGDNKAIKMLEPVEGSENISYHYVVSCTPGDEGGSVTKYESSLMGRTPGDDRLKLPGLTSGERIIKVRENQSGAATIPTKWGDATLRITHYAAEND